LKLSVEKPIVSLSSRRLKIGSVYVKRKQKE
jgi:hypothetical protein